TLGWLQAMRCITFSSRLRTSGAAWQALSRIVIFKYRSSSSMSTSLRQISPQNASIRGRMVNPRWHTSEAASIVMPHAAASRAFTLFLLAVFRHAGPVRVDLDIAPGVLDVLPSPGIALLKGLYPRVVSIGGAALASSTNSGEPNRIARVR